MRAAVAGCVCSALGLLCGSGTAGAGAVGITVFRTPSGNIGCGYVTGFGAPFLRCDIRSGLRPEPARACELDWTGLTLGATGRAHPTCAGDTVADPRAPLLAYGRTWARGGITCLSLRIALVCGNRSGEGFYLSKERWQV